MQVGKSNGEYNYEKTVNRTGKLTEDICRENYKKTIEDTGKLTENICKGNYKKNIEDTGKFTENICKGNYRKSIQDTGKITENICKGNYRKTVQDTGQLTENICKGKYRRKIDPSGNLHEKVVGKLTLESDGKMLLKTNNDDIEINAANQNRDVIINARKRIENTKEETEIMDWGMKTEIAGGHVNEWTYGFKNELMGGLHCTSTGGGRIDISPAFTIGLDIISWQKSVVNLIVHNIALKKQGADVTMLDTVGVWF
jgi:hypothetical protein